MNFAPSRESLLCGLATAACLLGALAPDASAQRSYPSAVSDSGQPIPNAIRPQQPASLDFGPSTFRRIATFEVFGNTSVDDETVAEIVTSANDGTVLIYTDSEQELLGFVDISDPTNPTADGTIDLGGEPTSVAVHTKWTLGGPKDYALACINTSTDFVNTSGELVVIDVDARSIVRTIQLGGQPDAIAVAPLGPFACICIENERDEDLGDGAPPQAPAGFLVIVDLFGRPAAWSTRTVGLQGICDLFPDDPEPEYVDINAFNTAVVTCQENNHIVLVDLVTGAILDDFSAGTVDLTHIDTNENDLIEQTASLDGVPREPDAVTWISQVAFTTADEGDLDGGSRGFTNWSALGGVPTFGPGNFLEHHAARLGHYPENRSENKGVEPEGAEFGWFGARRFLFVCSERANLVFVYEIVAGPISGQFFPIFRQALPTGVAPEGLHAIGSRDLFVVACEEDARDDKIRSSIMIYERSDEVTYPTLYSDNRDGTTLPIPWGALSGLAVGETEDTLYTVHDSFYQRSRVYEIDRSGDVAKIVKEIELSDPNGQLWVQLFLSGALAGFDIPDFDIDAIINADKSVNLDLEGIDVDENGDFWLVTEGAGNLVDGVSDANDRPFESPNFVIRADQNGVIKIVYRLPFSVDDDQFRFGFEGVAKVGKFVYVCFQRAWQEEGDPAGFARIGRLDTTKNRWQFAYYPLPAPTSPNGGWTGLSDLSYLGDDWFAVLVRDNQGGPDATIKRVEKFDASSVNWVGELAVPNFDVLQPVLVSDLLADDVFGPWAGLVPEKVEGLTFLDPTRFVIVNDNDGVDDNNGETLLIEVDLDRN